MYKISLEFNVDGENPLDAVKEFANILTTAIYDLTYIVQNEETSELFTVDLAEEDVDAVLPLKRYEQFIINPKQ